ncbi:GNAT family N-acetyltransferase [Candidatus Poribacteria bacterium]
MIDGPRGLMPDELDKLVDDVVSPVYSPRMRGRFPTLFCKENAHHLRIIRTDGKIVSHIGIVVRDMIISGCRISVGNVGAVATREDYRKRGYAWAVFEDAMSKLCAEGVDMFLISGSRNLYRLHGATHVGKVARYRITHDMKIPEAAVEPRPFDPSDLPAWAALHRGEQVRFHRPYRDFQALTERSPEHGRGLLYSIWEGDCISAYAVLGRRKSEEGDFAYLNEYAGSRRALMAAIPAWFGELNVPTLGATVPMHDTEFAGLINSTGAEVSYDSTGGTIAILNFPRLCRRMVPMFEEIVGRETVHKLTFQERNGSYIIGLDGDELVLDNAHDAARLIFGDPPDRDERTEISVQGELGEVLEAIFPIPRPEYGLSYI